MLATRNRVAALTTSAAGLVAVLVAWAVAGSRGPGSALLGTVLVLGFFLLGGLPFVVARQGHKGMAFLVLGMTYVLRVLLGVVVWAAAVQSPDVDRVVVGLTVIGCALVWVNTQVFLGLSRRHQPGLDV